MLHDETKSLLIFAEQFSMYQTYSNSSWNIVIIDSTVFVSRDEKKKHLIKHDMWAMAKHQTWENNETSLLGRCSGRTLIWERLKDTDRCRFLCMWNSPPKRVYIFKLMVCICQVAVYGDKFPTFHELWERWRVYFLYFRILISCWNKWVYCETRSKREWVMFCTSLLFFFSQWIFSWL